MSVPRGAESRSLRTGTGSVRKSALTCRFLTLYSAPTITVVDVAMTNPGHIIEIWVRCRNFTLPAGYISVPTGPRKAQGFTARNPRLLDLRSSRRHRCGVSDDG